MTNSQNPARAIEFRNSTIGITVAQLRETRPHLVADDLHKLLGGMPDFFSGEPTLLDFSTLDSVPGEIDWAGLLSLFRRFQLQPIGVRGLPESLAADARKAGFALLDDLVFDATTPPSPEPEPAPRRREPEPPPPPPPASPATSMFVDRPVRSGQQIYARGGDLVLLAGMSNGAEVIADGSIHCYGPLRGRALAGAQGDYSARILATNFGPEIVSIGGVYRTFERGVDPTVAGKPACLRLIASGSGQTLSIEPLQLD